MNLCIKNSYTNIQEYEKTMTYLVEEEFRELRKMKKNQTIKDIELQFILYSSKEIAGVKKFVWHVTFPLPKNLIPPEENGCLYECFKASQSDCIFIEFSTF